MQPASGVHLRRTGRTGNCTNFAKDSFFVGKTWEHQREQSVTTALYLRVSSQSQDIKSQEPDLHAWARAQAEPVTWYRDRFTGTTLERPGLERLLADVRASKISKVVVWRLDRLATPPRAC